MNMMKRLNQLSAHLDHVHHQPKSIAALAHSRSINSQPISTAPHADPASSLRLSASLIIIKPLESNTPDGFNYHTLLIQRNSTQRSFSSAYVFPGGNLDPDDHNLHPLIQKSINKTKLDEKSILQDSLKICAIRETFEESGIFVGLTRPIHNPDSLLKEFRQKLTNQLDKFSKILQYIPSDTTDPDNHSKSLFNLSQLWLFANFLTPTLFPKRWDTHFYLTILPPPIANNSGATQEDNPLEAATYLATPDGSETVLSVWLSPTEALKRCLLEAAGHKEYIAVAPPQFYILRELSQKKDYRELVNFQDREVPAFIPEMVKISDDHGAVTSALTLPGDSLHSSSEKLVKENIQIQPHLHAFKHRIFVQNEPDGFGKQAGKFFRPLRVQRCGMQKIFGSGWDDLN